MLLHLELGENEKRTLAQFLAWRRLEQPEKLGLTKGSRMRDIEERRTRPAWNILGK